MRRRLRALFLVATVSRAAAGAVAGAGPTAVESARGGPTADTGVYVLAVTTFWRRLRGCK